MPLFGGRSAGTFPRGGNARTDFGRTGHGPGPAAQAQPPPPRDQPPPPRDQAANFSGEGPHDEDADQGLSMHEVESRIQRCKDHLDQLYELLKLDYSQDLWPMVEILVTEAKQEKDEMQHAGESCIAENRFDLLEQVASVASRFEEVLERVEAWKTGGERPSLNSAIAASPGDMSPDEVLARELAAQFEEEAKERAGALPAARVPSEAPAWGMSATNSADAPEVAPPKISKREKKKKKDKKPESDAASAIDMRQDDFAVFPPASNPENGVSAAADPWGFDSVWKSPGESAPVLNAAHDFAPVPARSSAEVNQLACASAWPLPTPSQAAIGHEFGSRGSAGSATSSFEHSHSSAQRGSQRATMRIQCPFDAIAQDVDRFTDTFVKGIAQAAGVAPHRVRVQSVRPG